MGRKSCEECARSPQSDCFCSEILSGGKGIKQAERKRNDTRVCSAPTADNSSSGTPSQYEIRTYL